MATHNTPTPKDSVAKEILEHLLSADYIHALQEILSSLQKNRPGKDTAFPITFLGFLVSLSKKGILTELCNTSVDGTADNGRETGPRALVAQILALLEEKLPAPLRSFVPAVPRSSQAPGAPRKLDVLHEFQKLVFESLVKNSKHEIWNSLNIFLRTERAEVEDPGVATDFLLNVLSYSCSEHRIDSPEEAGAGTEVGSSNDAKRKIKIFQEIAFLLEPEDQEKIEKILLFFDDSNNSADNIGTANRNAALFFLILRFCNPPVFSAAMETVYSEKRFYREALISALPVLDAERLIPYIKDYNWAVTAAAIEKRPSVVPRIIRAFQEGELGMQRKFFLDAIAAQDKIFSNFFPGPPGHHSASGADNKQEGGNATNGAEYSSTQDYSLQAFLTNDEISELSSKSIFFAKKYFLSIETEDQMAQFCKNFTKKFPESISDLFVLAGENPLQDSNDASSSRVFEMFLKALLRTYRLTGELKSLVVSRYSKDPRFFHALVSYLPIGEIEENLQRFYQKDLSLECLLRLFNPQELLIELHQFHVSDSSEDVGALLVRECIGSKRFEDQDWVLALKFLEKTEAPLKMETCLLLLQEKPSLRPQAVSFMKRSLGETVWKYRKCTADFLLCLEELLDGKGGDQLVGVCEAMTKEELLFVLRRAEKVFIFLEKFISLCRKPLSPSLQFIETCLYQA